MLVELGASSAVPVNYLLALDVLRIPVLVGASEVYVNIPSQLDEPVVTIVGPTQLSNCESTLVLDASGSSGSGTFPWAFVQWSLVVRISDLVKQKKLKIPLESLLRFQRNFQFLLFH